MRALNVLEMLGTKVLKNGNTNCITAKTLELHNILVFIAKSDIILRLDIRKEV